jgi:hypothetical protein
VHDWASSKTIHIDKPRSIHGLRARTSRLLTAYIVVMVLSTSFVNSDKLECTIFTHIYETVRS